MKKQLFFLSCLLLPFYIQAQMSSSDISNILTDEHICIYNLYNTDIRADEQLIVENYTDDETSFTILSYSTICEKWCFLTKTPNLLTYNQSFNHGRITANSYKYRFKEPIKMGTRQFYSRPFTKMAILTNSQKQYSIKLIEEGYNLVIRIYPKGTEKCFQPMVNANKNDIDSSTSLSQDTQDIQQTYTPIHTTEKDTKKITRHGGVYMYDGQSLYAGLGKNSDYRDFLNNNCTFAFQRFESGRKMAISGWGLLSVGLCLDFGSVISIFRQVLNNQGRISTPAITYIYAIGCAFEGASIPLLAVGYYRMHQSADIYNVTNSSKQTALYWSVNADANGLGFALNF